MHLRKQILTATEYSMGYLYDTNRRDEIIFKDLNIILQKRGKLG